MNEQEEAAYLEGERSAWRRIISTGVRELGMESRAPEFWILEREAAIAVLRRLCRAHGDNDWDPDLHVADILDKHLRWD